MGTGSTIKSLLSQKGMTIKQLAEITGIPKNTLYSITKRDTESIYSDNLQRILKALGLTSVDFYTEKAKQIGDRLIRIRDEAFPFGDPGRLSMPDESGFGDCRLSEDEQNIIGAYWRLNNAGKKEALKRILELGEINTYTQPEE